MNIVHFILIIHYSKSTIHLAIIGRARTFGRGTVRRGTVHRKKKLVSASLGLVRLGQIKLG